MCTPEQKEKIKKLALSGLKPREIKKKMPDLDWDNKRIGQWLYEQNLNGKSEKLLKISEKKEEKLTEKIAEKQADFTADIQDLVEVSIPELKSIINDPGVSKQVKINAIKVVMDISGLKKEKVDNNITGDFINQLPFEFPEA